MSLRRATQSTLALLNIASSALSLPLSNETSAHGCRNFPGDAGWPSAQVWADLNNTINGQLIATVPLAAACHDSVAPDGGLHRDWPSYDEEKCASLQESWLDSGLHDADPASIMAPYFANQSCDPFLPRSSSCVIGTYSQYTVNVTGAADVAAGLKFAEEHNVRLVIHNTGHDFAGKSSGAGSLSLWTHNLKDIEFVDWSDEYYSGKAIKIGAGVQGFEVNAAAYQQGLQVVTGECPNVGIAGGYTQGGGHSALSSRLGLAADNALEYEVVVASGETLIANRFENTDLYWALSGGGGGTYGVVLSLTAKAHPDVPTAGANLTFTSEGLDPDVYYAAIETFTASLPASADAGVMTVFYYTSESFAISPATGPNLNKDQLKDFFAPLMDHLEAANISYTSHFQDFDSYVEFYEAMFAPIPVGVTLYGGAFIPRGVAMDNPDGLSSAFRDVNAMGAQVVGIGINTSLATGGFPDNSVNVGWRDALIGAAITVPWSFEAPWQEMLDSQDLLTESVMPRLKEVLPGGGHAYLNEGDFQDPDWKRVFYGGNYDRLEEIKNKYDPNHLFYALTAVGSDYWEAQPDGRLCKA